MGIFIQKKERRNKGPHFRSVQNEKKSYAIRGVASYLLNTIFRFVFRMVGQYLLNYNEISGTRQYGKISALLVRRRFAQVAQRACSAAAAASSCETWLGLGLGLPGLLWPWAVYMFGHVTEGCQ